MENFEESVKFKGPSSFIDDTEGIRGFITGYDATEEVCMEDVDIVVEFSRDSCDPIKLSLSVDHAEKLYATLGEYLKRQGVL